MESFDAITMAHPIRVYFTNEEDYVNFLLLSVNVSLMFYIIMWYCYFKTDTSSFRINIGLFRQCRNVSIIIHNFLMSFISFSL